MEENGVETPLGANQEEEEEMVPRGKKKVAHFEMQHARSLRVNERTGGVKRRDGEREKSLTPS